MTPFAIALPALLITNTLATGGLSAGTLSAGALSAPPPAATATAATPPAAASPPGFAERLHAETNVAGGLTAAQVATRTEAQSGAVAAKRAEIDVAAAAVDQAFVAFFPRLTGLARYTRYSAIDAPLLGTLVAADAPEGPLPAGTQLVNVPLRFPVVQNATTFQASLALPISDYVFRLSQAHAAAVRNEVAAELNAEAARRKTRAEAMVFYYEWARAKLSRVVAEAASAQAEGHLEDVRRSFEAGVASRADVLRVEAQVAAAEQLNARAETLTTALAHRLRTAMHLPSDAPLAIGEPVDVDFVPTESFPSNEARGLDHLATLAEGARPEVRALDATWASLGKQASATRGAAFPVLAVVGEVTDANPNLRYTPPPERFQTTWSVTAQIAWSPNDTFTATAAARGVDARRATLAAQRVALIEGLRTEIASALQALDEATQAEKNAGRAVEAAEESYRVRRSLFQNGRATSVELTDAETELTRARLDLMGARIAARVAAIQLRHAAGQDQT